MRKQPTSLAAVTEVQASIVEGSIIQRNPGGYHRIEIIRAKIEIVLMHWFWAANFGRLKKDLTEKGRGFRAENLFNRFYQLSLRCHVAKCGSMKYWII